MGFFTLLFGGIIALLLTFIISFILKIRKNEAYFKKRGMTYVGGVFTDTWKFFLGLYSIVDIEEKIYNSALATKQPLIGMSDFIGKPNVYVTDLDLLKAINVKDFDHFVNRRPVGTQSSNTYFKNMLFSMESDEWKALRAKLSPCFTSGKIKRMFQIFKTSSERMDAYLKEQMSYPTEKSADIDFMQIFPKYAMDVIASCAFGIDSKSFEVAPDQKSTFEKMGNEFGFRFHPRAFLRFALVMGAPKIADLFGVDLFDYESSQYFSGVVKDVMKRRRQTGERRDDFLQLMLDAQQDILKADEESNLIMNGTVVGDSGSGSSISTEGPGKVVLTDDAIIGNGLAFLMAGFDPTQSTLLFCLHGLAMEPEVQEKVYNEVKQVIDKHGGKLTYDGVNEMKYMDMVLNESMRFYPVATRTERYCTKDFPVPGTNVVIEKGTIVLLPIRGLHQDPRNFANPAKFDPERFNPENKAARHPYAFTPFGHGPRNCIGMRFALIKVKTVIAQLVLSYKLSPCSKTKIPLEYDRNPNVKPKDSMWLNITVRE